MQDTGFVWVDGRWRESGWLLAFRIRLTGWLPAGEAEAARAQDLIRSIGDGASSVVELTEKGISLTEVSAPSHEEYNVRILADVLQIRGFKSNWLVSREGERSVFLSETQVFAADYRQQVLGKLGRRRHPSHDAVVPKRR